MKIALILVLTMLSSMAENRLKEAEAARFVRLALAGLDREFPNKPGHVLRSPDDAKTPRELHPVFFGHFDWHSSVHGHWTLVRLLRLYPDADWSGEVRAALEIKFQPNLLKVEVEYLEKNPSFERMYGWAWALRLGIELRALDDEQGKRWAANYQPVEKVIVGHAAKYLPKLDWPIRCGFHPESAFPLGQMIDWARATGDQKFEELLTAKAKAFYGDDTNYPVRYEPSGNDFFSPGLNEASLMSQVLPKDEFSLWFGKFFSGGDLGNLAKPVTVSDLEDGHLVHLVGLNLSRAWNLRRIADALPEVRSRSLLAASVLHEKAGLEDTFSGSYEGEHWLGTFAVYLLTGAGQK